MAGIYSKILTSPYIFGVLFNDLWLDRNDFIFLDNIVAVTWHKWQEVNSVADVISCVLVSWIIRKISKWAVGLAQKKPSCFSFYVSVVWLFLQVISLHQCYSKCHTAVILLKQKQQAFEEGHTANTLAHYRTFKKCFSIFQANLYLPNL